MNLLNKLSRLLVAVGLCSVAGGMGWGIRGQYGHESGAMIAGLLVSSVVAFLYCRETGCAAGTLRAVAWCTTAFGIGGSMTYGQTIGLTQEASVIGNWASWCWGMLGLAIKGGTWIGFGGVFLGMGLGGIRYTRSAILFLMLVLVLFYHLGVWLLNSPFDPQNGLFPAIYFSNPVHKPRLECWGGLVMALFVGLVYSRYLFGDVLAFRMGLFGVMGGFIGFPVGQCFQSWHAWNLDWFRSGWFAHWDPLINWWNLMEIIFGMVMGGFLGLGAWLNRGLIRPSVEDTGCQGGLFREMFLLFIHLLLLSVSEFSNIPIINQVYGLGLGMALIPMVACARSSNWSAFLLGPIIVLPIAGKTLRRLVYEGQMEPALGWIIYFIAPMVLSVLFVFVILTGIRRNKSGSWVGALVLFFGSWIFNCLNFAFFDYPWFWNPWTARTPSAMVYSVFLLILMLGAVVIARKWGTEEIQK